MTNLKAENTSSSSSSQFASGLKDALRGNPVAAGLIGLGAIWLFVGGSRLAAVGGALAGTVGNVGSAASSGASSVAEIIGDGVSTATSAAGSAARQLRDGLTNFPSPEEENKSPAASRNSAQESEFFGSTQRMLSQTLERQPLVLGGIGLAIGAVIASAFAATKSEREYIGETAGQMRKTAEAFATHTLDTAGDVGHEVLRTIRAEAKNQGFTPSALSDNLDALGEKLKTVAGATQASLKDHL